MIQYGRKHCATLSNSGASYDTKLAATYYDAQWVYYQIGDYTGDPSWYDCANAAESIYRDQYLVPSGGVIPGYWHFSHGLAEDYLRTGDEASRSALVLASKKAAYARNSTPSESTVDVLRSREVAYTIMSYLNAELVGESRRNRLTVLIVHALGHIDQWFISKTAPYVKPFMVGLTSHALISYAEQVGDQDVVPALEAAMDWLWNNVWIPEEESFLYIDRFVIDQDPPNAAPDLNLLIAPAYAWLYHKTGKQRFLTRGDAIFSGGVRRAFISNQAKQFNQNYRWSFEYLRWRRLRPEG